MTAPARMDHPFPRALSREMLARSTSDATLSMPLNAAAFQGAIRSLSRQHGVPLFGSSARLSLSGTRFRVEDTEPEIPSIADALKRQFAIDLAPPMAEAKRDGLR
jgi:hypothetical protein